MSRTLTASFCSLTTLLLISCVQETDAPATPEPPVSPVSSVSEPADVEEDSGPQDTSERPTEPVPVADAQPNPELPTSSAATESTPPSSGNPVIDFFRSVDRGVKSTSPETNRPLPNEGETDDERSNE